MRNTYHDGHGGAGGGASDKQQAGDHLPALVALLLAAQQNDGVSDEHGELDDDGEGHEEADGAPAAAEGPRVATAVRFLGEVATGAGNRVAERVQTVRYLDGLAMFPVLWRE